MEKCTYCVQRISARARSTPKNEDRPIRDGEITTACQQACPSQAIVFGDLNDETSRVAKLREAERSYGVLDRAATRSRGRRTSPRSATRTRRCRAPPPGRRTMASGARVDPPATVDHPIIGPGHTFASVTDKIASLVLSKKTPLGWFVGFGISFALLNVFLVAVTLPAREGHRDLGHQRPRRLGLRDHQLRLVDRHRPRRHAHLRDPAPAAAAVAHVDQPLRRGDDALRGRLRRASSRSSTSAARGSAYWLLPYPNTMGLWPQLPEPAHLGRVRGLDLRDGVAPLLVRRPHPRPRDAARPRRAPGRQADLRACSRWAGAARRGTGSELRDRVPDPRRPLDAARRLRAHRRELRLRDRAGARAGTPRSSRPTSWPAPSTPASRWC